jgi:hypothetical protein
VKTNKLVLSTTIDYDARTAESLQREMQEHQQKRGSTGSPFTKSPYFTKFYRSDAASGMSLAAVGKFIRDAGSTPNNPPHCLVVHASGRLHIQAGATWSQSTY